VSIVYVREHTSENDGDGTNKTRRFSRPTNRSGIDYRTGVLVSTIGAEPPTIFSNVRAGTRPNATLARTEPARAPVVNYVP